MQECGAAAQIPEDEQWLFNRLCFVSRKKNIVQEETEPVDELADRPDSVKQEKENDSFAGKTGGGMV